MEVTGVYIHIVTDTFKLNYSENNHTHKEIRPLTNFYYMYQKIFFSSKIVFYEAMEKIDP